MTEQAELSRAEPVAPAAVKVRLTDAEIQARIEASRLRKKPQPETSKTRAEARLALLQAAGKLTREADGRILIGGNTVFFTHYRNEKLYERTEEGFQQLAVEIIRSPSDCEVAEGYAATLAYYFADDKTVKAAITVKSPNDNYDRRYGNVVAVERLVQEDPRYFLAIPAEDVVESAVGEQTVFELSKRLVLNLFGPAVREKLSTLFGEVRDAASVRELSHYVVHDELIKHFLEKFYFVREAIEEDFPTE